MFVTIENATTKLTLPANNNRRKWPFTKRKLFSCARQQPNCKVAFEK